MIFKPRVFISSSLRMGDIRKRLTMFFRSVGMEPLVYERNLTPSTEPATYREDILSADFVIVIVGEERGTPTETGKTGTHEEWEIAKRHHIPMHVYLRHPWQETSTTAEDASGGPDPLAELVQGDMASVYYYSTKNDLIKRIKESTATISKEITLSQVEQERIPQRMIWRLALNRDYALAAELLREFHRVDRYYWLNDWDYTRTTVYAHLCEYFEELWHRHRRQLFLDRYLNARFDRFLSKMQSLATYSSDHFFMRSGPDLGNWHFGGDPEGFEISLLTRAEARFDTYDQAEYDRRFRSMQEAHGRFRQAVEHLKSTADIEFGD